MNELVEACNQYITIEGNSQITLEEFHDLKYPSRKREYFFIKGEIDCNCKKQYIEDYIRIGLFHIWRCVNLSYPGILSFYNCNLYIKNKIVGTLDLCTDCTQGVYDLANKLDSVAIRILDLKETWRWYQSVVDIKKYYTSNKFDRAITGYFNFIKNDGFLETNILNLFCGIESFYSLAGTNILNSLKRRSTLFLKIDKNKKHFCKQIAEFYNYRSRYVHGDKDLIVFTDAFDSVYFEDSEGLYGEFLDRSEFGMYFLLVSIQNAILEGKYEIEFEEIIK